MHPLNAPSPIDVADGIDIVVNDEHRWKELFPIVWIDDKSDIFDNIEQFEKVDSPIDVIVGGIDTCSNEIHSWKQKSPMKETEDGISICFNDEHPWKA